MNHRPVPRESAGPVKWSSIFAGSFGLLNLSFIVAADSSPDSPFAVVGYIATIATTVLFGLLWLKLVEKPRGVRYLRGGLVGVLAPLMAYVLLSVALLPFSIFGIIGIVVLWLTAIYTVPISVVVGVLAIVIRKRT